MFCSPGCRTWTFLSLGIFFFVVGLVILVLWNTIVETIKSQQLSLGSNNTKEYDFWKVTPIPMYLEVHLFNWTNCKAVIDSNWSIKPLVTEVGPYTFTEKHIRRTVQFNQNHTLTYKTQRVWHFVPEKSNGSLEDEITTLNVILLVAGNYLKNEPYPVRIAANFILEEKGIKLTITRTVREFLFDGYEDPILKLLEALHLKHFTIPFTKFGWFADRNESIDYDGVYNMFDGSDDVRKLGRLASWNYNTSTMNYKDSCGEVRGTSGELWYPVQNDDTAQVFSNDLCSTISLYREGTGEKLDVTGNKFVGNEHTFDNGSKFPDMACFSPGEVVPSGVRNISECKFNAPAFVSYPHFYLADPSYLEAVDGMRPNKTKHQLFITIEPETGIPIEAHVSVQVNLRVQGIPNLKQFYNVKTTFLPVLWFKQYAQIDNTLADQAKLILTLPTIGIAAGSTILSLGIVLLIVVTILSLKRRIVPEEEQEPLTQEES